MATVAVYELKLIGIRLDSMTSCGYHAVTEEGVMQFGPTRDHRQDLPQLKLLAATAESSDQLLACDVDPGQCTDDPLYTPLIQRVRQTVGRTGLLYAGDDKVAALSTRAELACETTVQVARWVDAIVDGPQATTALSDQLSLP